MLLARGTVAGGFRTGTGQQKRGRSRLGPLLLAGALLYSAPAATLDLGQGDPDPRAYLPTPLSETDAGRYQRIFALQKAGDWRAADEAIETIHDPLLMGHVMAQRLLHPGDYRASYEELAAWLSHYADHPQASRMHRLARRRAPAGMAPPELPDRVPTGISLDRQKVGSPPPPLPRSLLKELRSLMRLDRPTQAARLLRQQHDDQPLEKAAYARAETMIAAGYLNNGKIRDALAFANRAANSAGDEVPLAHWRAGLAAWRLGYFDLARHHFERLTLAEAASPWLVSAGAVWAARVHGLAGRGTEEQRLLRRAARPEINDPPTFYGLIARQALGEPLVPGIRRDAIDGELLARYPGARRALALLQVDRPDGARAELTHLYPVIGTNLAPSLVAIAEAAGMTRLAFRIGRLLEQNQGLTHLAALYPVPDWQPSGGFSVDRALIYALVRQESRFDPEAVSKAGARGLMQLMPMTAKAVARRAPEGSAGRLEEPADNLALGQHYLTELLAQPRIAGDLYRTLAAYNAGPGALGGWLDRMDHRHDPLLFIESIPIAETRHYIEEVLAAFWIYRTRLGQPVPSLTEAAAGDAPIYRPLDQETVAEITHVVQ